jgi:class 3 adenylate cyclase/CHASE2 domain-containing sensor protein
MDFLKKLLKSLIIGTLMGLAIAFFTDRFFSDIIDRLENQTYDRRYRWEFEGVDKKIRDDYGIYIIDIDERSMDKMGLYWNWNRSYHAKMLRAIKKHYPAAVLFDITFDDLEDHTFQSQLQSLLQRSSAVDNTIKIPVKLGNAIINTIDYDRQFIAATAEAGCVFLGIRLAEESDYSEGLGVEKTKEKMSLEWHNRLHPSSVITFPQDIYKKVVTSYNSKPIIDGIFPEMAQAAKEIAYVNFFPDGDGTVRSMPIFLAFGNHGPVYLPLSVRTVASLFATPNDEITLEPCKHLDIGKPFKIFRDKEGTLSCSYPHVTPAQVQAIMEHADALRSLEEGKEIEICSRMVVGMDENSGIFLDMFCGLFPAEVLGALFDSSAVKKALSLKPGESLSLTEEISVRRDESEVDWVLSAPYGDEEWWLNALDLKTILRVRPEHFDGLELLFYSMTVRRTEGALVSSIPVLRGHTLDQLLATKWTDIEQLAPGGRMDFGDNLRIPLNHNNQHFLTFFGPRKKPFPYHSYYDITEERTQGALEGKIFLVGSTVPALFDIKPVPHEKNYPGVEIHASLIAAFLTNTFVTRLEKWQDFLILVLVGIALGVITYMMKPLFGGILTVVLIFAYFLMAMTVFGTNHLWIEIVRPILTIFLTFAAVMAYRYITEEKDRKFLQSTFKQYLSPELIDIMYKQKQQPQLGGEEGVRTAYFTDIQGFSTFSEKLGSPTRLVELLNEYLTVMTDTLMAHLGTLDKYEGDAIIAFFGAPMPMEDHALQACKAALGMQAKLGELRQKWISEGDKWPAIVHQMRMRIGVNTGQIVTGNMGSRMRMNYTMMGDAVNLAARLESAAKQYGIYSMISEFTYELVKNDFELRQLDKITVVGKSEPVVIYELMAEKGGLPESTVKMLESYRQGMEYFYAQEWDKAISQLQQSHELEPFKDIAPKSMTPSRKLISYCEDFKANPPGAEWDGVIRLTSK